MSIEEFSKEDILKAALEVESKENLLVGDIWVTIDHEKYEHGIFLQFESKDLEDGSYSEDIFCVYGYENILVDGVVESNYDKAIVEFEFNKKELEEFQVSTNENLPYTEFLEQEFKGALDREKFDNEIIKSSNENFDNLLSKYEEINKKYLDIVEVSYGLQAFVNSMSYDISALKKCDLTSEDARELKILEKVSSDLLNILNKDKSKNDNSALEQIRNEMTAPKETTEKETTIQSNARRNK